jgi:hypothetical protein
MTATATAPVRELDRRSGDGLEVRLLWRPADDVCLVAVSDSRTGDAFSVRVEAGERATDVFHHPFAYAASHRRLEAVA